MDKELVIEKVKLIHDYSGTPTVMNLISILKQMPQQLRVFIITDDFKCLGIRQVRADIDCREPLVLISADFQ